MAASVVIKPRRDGTIRPPVWASRNAPVPKVHFAWPGADAALADQRRLLVAGDSHDRHAVGQVVQAQGLAEFARARADFGQYLRRDAE